MAWKTWGPGSSLHFLCDQSGNEKKVASYSGTVGRQAVTLTSSMADLGHLHHSIFRTPYHGACITISIFKDFNVLHQILFSFFFLLFFLVFLSSFFYRFSGTCKALERGFQNLMAFIVSSTLKDGTNPEEMHVIQFHTVNSSNTTLSSTALSNCTQSVYRSLEAVRNQSIDP